MQLLIVNYHYNPGMSADEFFFFFNVLLNLVSWSFTYIFHVFLHMIGLLPSVYAVIGV